MAEPFPDTPPSERPTEELLDSWKEIAAYLERDVTTVQRWEKREGMPVHRHVHDKRGSVYALGAELDAWRQNRGLRLREEDEEQASKTRVAVEEDQGPSATARSRRWFALAGVAVLVVVLVRSCRRLLPIPRSHTEHGSTQDHIFSRAAFEEPHRRSNTRIHC